MNTNADRLRKSDIPFINLSKENLILIYDSLEAEQAGNMLFKLTEYLYQGTEPTFDTKIEKSVWNNVMLLVNRKAEGYFTKAEVARENGKKGGRPRKTQPQQDAKEEATEISHISPSEGIKEENDIQIPNEIERPTEAIKTTINDIVPNEFMDGLENTTEKSNITTEEIKEIMGNYIGEVEKLNNKTTGENSNFDFDNIDRLIPKPNKEMAIRQIRIYLPKEENLRRLNDALSVFLDKVSKEVRYEYYNVILAQCFSV